MVSDAFSPDEGLTWHSHVSWRWTDKFVRAVAKHPQVSVPVERGVPVSGPERSATSGPAEEHDRAQEGN